MYPRQGWQIRKRYARHPTRKFQQTKASDRPHSPRPARVCCVFVPFVCSVAIPNAATPGMSFRRGKPGFAGLPVPYYNLDVSFECGLRLTQRTQMSAADHNPASRQTMETNLDFFSSEYYPPQTRHHDFRAELDFHPAPASVLDLADKNNWASREPFRMRPLQKNRAPDPRHPTPRVTGHAHIPRLRKITTTIVPLPHSLLALRAPAGSEYI